jgi:hypothetical protein
LRFGNKRETYLEFKKKLRLKKRSDFGVEFKTSESDGIIFYIADEKNSDFIALFVKNGKLVYGFNCGSGPVYIESPQPINDGRYEQSRECVSTGAAGARTRRSLGHHLLHLLILRLLVLCAPSDFEAQSSLL